MTRIGTRRLSRKDEQELARDYVHSSRHGEDGAKKIANRHDRDRWLRQLREAAAVAHDLLIGGERGRSIGVLLYLVALEDAIALTGPKISRLADYVGITITTFTRSEIASTLAGDLEDAVFQALATTPKIPYTNAGIAMLQREIERVMAQTMPNTATGEYLDRMAIDAGVFRRRATDETEPESDASLRERVVAQYRGPMMDSEVLGYAMRSVEAGESVEIVIPPMRYGHDIQETRTSTISGLTYDAMIIDDPLAPDAP